MVEVINDLLGYDNIKIIQNPEMFNFSLDSILLADFVKLNKKTKHIADLCSGNAPIPLYLSLRTNANITGIEIQEKVFSMGYRSIALNNLQKQITFLNDDVKSIYKKIGSNRYDVVTCNPPFFKYTEQSNINKNDFLTIARHEVKITLEDVMIEANRLLKSGSNFYMIHRPERLTDILCLLRKNKLEPKRVRFVYPRRGKNPISILLEAKKDGNKDGLIIVDPLYVMKKNSNDYTKEILKMFHYGK